MFALKEVRFSSKALDVLYCNKSSHHPWQKWKACCVFHCNVSDYNLRYKGIHVIRSIVESHAIIKTLLRSTVISKASSTIVKERL